MKLGGSITIRPELKYYDEEKAPEGQVVDDVRFCFKNANEAAVNITDNEDGTYTIKRTAVFENDFEFSAEFTNVDGDEDAIDYSDDDPEDDDYSAKSSDMEYDDENPDDEKSEVESYDSEINEIIPDEDLDEDVEINEEDDEDDDLDEE